MTLVEIVIATGVTSILALLVCSGIIYSGRSLAALGNYIEMDNSARSAIDTMMTAIRQAYSVSAISANNLTIQNTDGSTIQYAYTTNKELTLTQGSYSKVLLTNCTSLSFLGYSRAPQSGSWTPWAATSAGNCKMVEIQWVCVRDVLGNTKQTESVQTARVVVRN